MLMHLCLQNTSHSRGRHGRGVRQVGGSWLCCGDRTLREGGTAREKVVLAWCGGDLLARYLINISEVSKGS